MLAATFPEPVTHMLWSANGKLHVVAGDVHTDDGSQNFILHRLPYTFSYLTFFAILPDGFAVGSRGTLVTVRHADLITHHRLSTALGSRLMSSQGVLIDLAAACNSIIAVYKDFGANKILLFDAFEGSELEEIDIEFPGGDQYFFTHRVVFTRSSTFLLACHGHIYVCDRTTRRAYLAHADHAMDRCIAIHERGLMAFSNHASDDIFVFALEHEKILTFACGGPTVAAAWSADTEFLVAATKDAFLIWHWETAQIVCRVPAIAGVVGVALRPQTPWIIAYAYSRNVTFVNVRNAFAVGLVPQSILFLILCARQFAMPPELWHYLYDEVLSGQLLN